MDKIERIDEWRGQDVVDGDGEKLGKADEVFYPAGGGEPEFIAVKSGLFGRRTHLVPLVGASFARGYIRVAFSAKQISGATEAPDGTLDARAEAELAAVYGLQPRGVDFESGSLIEERRARAEETRRRADELEDRAHEQVSDVQEARRDAEQAAVRADEVERESRRAREEAQAARADADALGPGPTPAA